MEIHPTDKIGDCKSCPQAHKMGEADGMHSNNIVQSSLVQNKNNCDAYLEAPAPSH